MRILPGLGVEIGPAANVPDVIVRVGWLCNRPVGSKAAGRVGKRGGNESRRSEGGVEKRDRGGTEGDQGKNSLKGTKKKGRAGERVDG